MNYHLLKRVTLFELKKLSNFDLLIQSIIFSLLMYIIIRAKFLSFTHDESLSYLAINSQNAWLKTANNHILNTIFMKISECLFGESELALRLPNIIAHALFMWMGWKILKTLYTRRILKTSSTLFVIFCGFWFLNTNPFMLDFFSLARGYGLSLGFLMTSVYFFIRDVCEHSVNNKWIFAFLFSSLSTIANFNLLNYHLSIIAIMITIEFFNYRYTSYLQRLKNILRNNQIFFIINLCFIVLASCWLMFLKNRGELYYGGDNGVIKDSIDSLIRVSLYFNNYNQKMIILIRYFILFVFMGMSGITLYVATSYKKVTGALCMLIIINLNIFIVIIQHYLVQTLYPIERTALFFLPLFFLYFTLCMEETSRLFKKLTMFFIIPVLVVLCIIWSLNFFYSINFTQTYTWNYDSNTKIMMQDLYKEYMNMNNKPTSVMLGIDWLFEPTTNYYRISRRFTWLQPTTREGYLEKKYDFYYLFENESKKLQKNQDISIINRYVMTNTILAIQHKNK